MSTENPYNPPSAEIADNNTSSNLASRWRRLGGALIDGLIIALITLPIMYLTGYIERATSGTTSTGEVVLMGLLGMVVFFVLNSYLLINKGQTIGKLALDTQIVSVENENLLPFGKLIGLRYVPLWVVSQVPFVGAIVGLANALFIFRSDKRCLHDLLAGTKVINYRAA